MNIIINYSHFFNLTCAYPGKARAAPGLAMRSNNDNDNINDNDDNDNKNENSNKNNDSNNNDNINKDDDDDNDMLMRHTQVRLRGHLRSQTWCSS